MTTVININAACGTEKEVVGRVDQGETTVEGFTIQDGETKEILVYDERVFTVREVEKQATKEITED